MTVIERQEGMTEDIGPPGTVSGVAASADGSGAEFDGREVGSGPGGRARVWTDTGTYTEQTVTMMTEAMRGRIDRLAALFGVSRGGIIRWALAKGGIRGVERAAAEQFGAGWQLLADEAYDRVSLARTRGRAVGRVAGEPAS